MAIFVVITLFTMQQKAASDGIDAYGFPFVFYDYFGGKCNDCYDEYGFKPLFLGVDLTITMAIVYVTTKVLDLYRKK